MSKIQIGMLGDVFLETFANKVAEATIDVIKTTKMSPSGEYYVNFCRIMEDQWHFSVGTPGYDPERGLVVCMPTGKIV